MKMKDAKLIAKYFKRIVSTDPYLVILLIIHTLLTAILPFIEIIFPKYLVDELIGECRMYVIVGMLITFLSGSMILVYCIERISGIFTPRMIKFNDMLIESYNEKCLSIDYAFIESSEYLNNASLAYKALNKTDEGIQSVILRVFALLSRIISFIGFMAILSTLNGIILVILVICICIIYFSTLRAREYENSMRPKSAEYDRKSGYMYKIINDFSYGKEVRNYNLLDWLLEKYNQILNERIKIYFNIQVKFCYVGIITSVLILFREAFTYFYLVSSVLRGTIGIGSFSMYFTTMMRFSFWSTAILDDLAFIRGQMYLLNEFNEFLNISSYNELDTGEDLINDNTYEFEFNNVTFKYPKTDKYIFKDFSFKINKGEMLAIVGINGAGKSTLIKLLIGLYKPDEGEILVNGKNIKSFNAIKYRNIFSVVFQDVRMFEFSAEENITLDDEVNTDNEKFDASIKNVGIAELLMNLPKGRKTSMLKISDNEGIEFSGGQKQKVGLARALYKDRKVLVFDEPTAALDPLAEYEMYSKMNQLAKNRTTIYISHRLASTRFCDKIIFIRDGRIIEEGTHERLLKAGGEYANLFAIQSQYYDESKKIAAGGNI